MRVLIIADNAVIAEGIRRGLRHAPSCQVVGYANGRIPCAATVASSAPDVIVFDDMHDRDAVLARIREARAALPEAKLLLLSTAMQAAWLDRAARAGVDAAIAKTAHLDSVGMLVREIVSGNVYHAFAAPAAVPENRTSSDILTARELEILRLVAAGLSNSRIAAKIWVAEQTVKFHLSNIYRKLGLANRTEASHYAHVHGLLQTPTAGSDDDSIGVAA